MSYFQWSGNNHNQKPESVNASDRAFFRGYNYSLRYEPPRDAPAEQLPALRASGPSRAKAEEALDRETKENDAAIAVDAQQNFGLDVMSKQQKQEMKRDESLNKKHTQFGHMRYSGGIFSSGLRMRDYDRTRK